jgi:hypothetical protein
MYSYAQGRLLPSLSASLCILFLFTHGDNSKNWYLSRAYIIWTQDIGRRHSTRMLEVLRNLTVAQSELVHLTCWKATSKDCFDTICPASRM